MNGYNPEKLSPPADNEIEFSLFGPGFGECAVCHLGCGEWLVVDSCLDPETKNPVALQYLQSMGIDPTMTVKAIVATHWHDDHIQGLSAVLKSIRGARFVITSAFDKEDFRVALAPWLDGGFEFDGKGLSEIRNILTQKRKPILAGENTVIYERHGLIECKVTALSPSNAASIACIAELAQIPKTQFRTRMPKLDGNHASVVLSIEAGERRILLGGDLQVRQNRQFGWLAVVDNHRGFSRPKHHVYKVPHHGSANADHPEIWEHLIEPNSHAVLSPFVNGKTKLPTQTDCNRIKGLTNRVSITAMPSAGKFHHEKRQVEKTMQETARSLEVIPHRFGHVRLRGVLDLPPDGWQMDNFGAAQVL